MLLKAIFFDTIFDCFYKFFYFLIMPENHRPSEITIEMFPFVEVDAKKTPPFCVDGRAGAVNGEKIGVYPQLLGGSLMPAVLEWLINRPDDDLAKVLPKVFQKLKRQGYPLGVHTSTHADTGKSDCGFADNLGNILKTFENRLEEIKGIISQVRVNYSDEVWQKIKGQLEQIDLNKLSIGEQLVKQGENLGAVKQVLDGEHREVATIVNLISSTTLDTNNNQDHQAFNLDLWLVDEIRQNFGWQKDLTQALSLGLYVATEMVLVERKGKPRLPILIKK